jgi:hypothetical protein
VWELTVTSTFDRPIDDESSGAEAMLERLMTTAHGSDAEEDTWPDPDAPVDEPRTSSVPHS